ncbi:cytochrome P450, partial [Elysia marginata]
MVSVMWLMNIPILSVNHPATLSAVLKNSNVKGSFMLKQIRPWIGNGLLTSSGKQWHRNRRLLTPAFHQDLLKRYVEVKNRCADILVHKFEKAAEADTCVEAFLAVGMCVLDILLKCAMTYETDCQLLGSKHPYVEATSKIQDIMGTRFFQPWLHNDFLFSLTPSGRKFFEHCNFVHQVAETIINKRQAEMDYATQKSPGQGEKKRRCLDLLDVLLTAKTKDGSTLSFSEIRDEVDTFLFTGYDSGTSAISWALYSIAQHPKIQSRVQEEIDSVLNHSDHTDVK